MAEHTAEHDAGTGARIIGPLVAVVLAGCLALGYGLAGWSGGVIPSATVAGGSGGAAGTTGDDDPGALSAAADRERGQAGVGYPDRLEVGDGDVSGENTRADAPDGRGGDDSDDRDDAGADGSPGDAADDPEDPEAGREGADGSPTDRSRDDEAATRSNGAAPSAGAASGGAGAGRPAVRADRPASGERFSGISRGAPAHDSAGGPGLREVPPPAPSGPTMTVGPLPPVVPQPVIPRPEISLR